jgi:outer membrane lipoprotein LolB
MIKIKEYFLLLILFLAGCATPPPFKASLPFSKQSISAREHQLSTSINNWKIAGKIAFINKNKRESASINWSYQEPTSQKAMQQRLDLTTLLGINVLHLSSQDDYHQVKIDGKHYHGKKLDEMLSALTGLTLPTQALTYWLKGLPYSEKDLLKYNEITNLPVSLTSQYDGKVWQVKYTNYQTVKNHQLATKLTITQNDLTILILIKRWSLNS